MRYPAAVTDLIFSKLQSSGDRVRVSQRAFYVLRKELIRTLGVDRQNVTLDTDLRSFIKGRSEQEVWNDLKDAIRARRWPELVRPKWLVGLVWLLSLGSFCGPFFMVHWMMAAALGLTIAFVCIWTTRLFRTRIPSRYSQLRDLVPFAVTSDAVVWTRDQVAELVRKLTIKNLGIRESRYREDAHFVKDLGMG